MFSTLLNNDNSLYMDKFEFSTYVINNSDNKLFKYLNNR